MINTIVFYSLCRYMYWQPACSECKIGFLSHVRNSVCSGTCMLPILSESVFMQIYECLVIGVHPAFILLHH